MFTVYFAASSEDMALRYSNPQRKKNYSMPQSRAKVLTSKNFREARALLYPIREKWYYLGRELGVPAAELDIVKEEHSDPKKCLNEVIRLWLKSIDPLPTWKALADVLRSEAISEVAMAEKGELVHLLGFALFEILILYSFFQRCGFRNSHLTTTC